MKISKLFIPFLVFNNSFYFFGIEECCMKCADCCRGLFGFDCYPCLKYLRLTIEDKDKRKKEKNRKKRIKEIKEKEEEKKLMRLLFNNKTQGTIQNLNNSNKQDYSLLKKIFDKIFVSINHEETNSRKFLDDFYPLSEKLYLNTNTQEILEEIPIDKKEFKKIQIDIYQPKKFKNKINYNLNPLYDDLTFSEYTIEIKYDFDDEDERKYKYIFFYIKVLDRNYDRICKNNDTKTCLDREIKNMNDLKEENEFNFFYGAFCYNKVFLCYNTSLTESIYSNLVIPSFLTKNFINNKMLTNYKDACLQLLKIIKGLRKLGITHRNISLKNICFQNIRDLDDYNILNMRLGGFELSSEQMKNKNVDENLKCEDCSGEYLYKSPIFKTFYIQKHDKEKYENINYFNAYNEDLFAIAVILYNIEKISENNLYEECPKREECLYFPIYENKISALLYDYNIYKDIIDPLLDKDPLLYKDNKKELTQEGIVKLFKEDIEAFKKYFESEDFLNNKEKLYNKIFWKFKDKNDNETIDIDEFINELNTNN